MKRLLTALVAAASLGWALPAAAQSTVVIDDDEDALMEIGVTAGWPTGLSAKYWLDSRRALGAGLAWNPSAEGLTTNFDYLMHSGSLIESTEMHVPAYAGIGARVAQYDEDDEVVFGPRVPLGVTAIFDALPLSVFAEIAPTVEVGRDDPDVTADATLGARLVF